jgi:hypothetical protein
MIEELLPFYTFKGNLLPMKHVKENVVVALLLAALIADSSCILGHRASSSPTYCCYRGNRVSGIYARVLGAYRSKKGRIKETRKFLEGI